MNASNGMNGEKLIGSGVADIENIVADAMKRNEDLDKTRGFVKYHRQKVIYRPPEQRLKVILKQFLLIKKSF